MAATQAYVICATPRCGSNLLADGLRTTGIAGDAQEYFSALADPPHPAQLRWYSTEDAEYLRRVFALGTTPNGVFGLKLHWHQLAEAVKRLRRVLQDDNLTEAQALGLVLPRPSYIWLQRRDKVAQAISFYRAISTGQWAIFEDSPGAEAGLTCGLEFNFGAISHLLNLCIRSELGWATFFAVHEINPFVVVYEDFIGAYDQTIRSVLQHLGLLLDYGTIAEPRLRRQADQLSVEWAHLFRELTRIKGTCVLHS
jgi:LPS sulfotransferase NodH